MTKTKSGLILPDDGTPPPAFGRVVSIGPDCKSDGDHRFQVGDIVTFNEQESETTTWGDEGEFTMLAECSVHAACTEEGADEDGVVTGLIPK